MRKFDAAIAEVKAFRLFEQAQDMHLEIEQLLIGAKIEEVTILVESPNGTIERNPSALQVRLESVKLDSGQVLKVQDEERIIR